MEEPQLWLGSHKLHNPTPTTSLPNTEILGGNDCHPTCSWVQPGSSVCPSFACSPSHHQVQVSAISRLPVYTRALAPGNQVAFFGGICHGAVSLPFERHHLTKPPPEGFSPALGFSWPPKEASRKTWPWITATTLPRDYVDGLMHEGRLAEVSLRFLMSSLASGAQMAASLVLLSRGENSPIKAAPTADTPVLVQKGLLSCLSACVWTAEPRLPFRFGG